MKNTETLKKNYEFRNILNKGSFYSGKYIQAFIFKNNKSLNYIGLAISSKTANAVTRNNIKRLLRENYKNFEENLKFGYSIVFLWNKKTDIKQADYFALLSKFEGYGMVIDEAKILNKKIIITDTAAKEAVKGYDQKLILQNTEDAIYEGLKQVILKNVVFDDSEGSFDNEFLLDEIKRIL